MQKSPLEATRKRLGLVMFQMARFVEIKMTDYLDWEHGRPTRKPTPTERTNLLGKLKMEGATQEELHAVQQYLDSRLSP